MEKLGYCGLKPGDSAMVDVRFTMKGKRGLGFPVVKQCSYINMPLFENICTPFDLGKWARPCSQPESELKCPVLATDENPLEEYKLVVKITVPTVNFLSIIEKLHQKFFKTL